MSIEDMTFGIEIETTIPSGIIRVGPHGHGIEVASLPGQEPGTHWKADRDPSINAGSGREACEFVSPVYRGSEGLAQLLATVEKIKAMGAQVNASCGIHIHVGFDKSDRAACGRLAALAANFEKAIFAATGTKARERGRWCNGIQRYRDVDNALSCVQHSRYHVVNFQTTKPTIEIRAFSASLNVKKIASYVRLSLALVQRALTAKRVPKFIPNPIAAGNSVHRSGEGQTALARMFYAFGWTKGRVDTVFGHVLAASVSLDDTKRTLMDLARKYDAMP